MSRRRSLRTRLAVSHLVVVAAGSVSIIIVAMMISPSFIRSHLMAMRMTLGEMSAAMTSELDEAFRIALSQVLLVAVAVSATVALIAAYVASGRLIEPITAVRNAARRMADGHYEERLALPDDHELAVLATDINRLAETLERTELGRMRLLNDVSHELRTPLSTIEGYMEAILDGVLEATPDVIASVAAESRRLKRLASDIGDLSRAEEGVLPLSMATVDLAAVATGVVERLRPQFDAGGVSLRLATTAPLEVKGDADRLVQVVTNVVGNALAHTPEAGTVTIRWGRRDRVAFLEVTDTGAGLRIGQTAQVFERFYKGDASTSGTGVGLTIARGIARLHGGELIAQSPGPGLGSTFRLELPLH